MAEKKTTKVAKKVAPKTAKLNVVADLRAKSRDELQQALAKARADLLELQKGLRAGELANPGAVRKARRHVAQVLTIIREKSESNEGKEAK